MHKDAIERIELVAAQQHGVFHADQARALHVSRKMLVHHTRVGGRWTRCAPEVYEVHDLRSDWRRPLMATTLSIGHPVAASHNSGGALLGLDGVDRQLVEVTTLDGRARPGWHVYRRDRVPPTMTTAGIPHTLPLRTISDLCLVRDDDHVEMALESALRKGLVSLGDLELLAATPGWKGVQRLRRVLSRRPPGAPPTRSELETRFIQLVRPLPVEEAVRGYEVVVHGEVVAVLDVAFPGAHLFVETDGGVHEQLEALRRDRQRQNDVVRILGWRPLRFTWTDVVARPVTTRRVFMEAYSMAVAV